MDKPIRALAERQHGVVARWQLLAMGITPRGIDWRREKGRLIPIYPGVYALGNRVLAPRGHYMAAALACGSGALLSHKSAGSVWGLLATSQADVDVIIPGASRDRYPGIRRHRTRHLHREDIAAIDGIPITSVARTVLDLAGVLRAQQSLEAIEQADRIGILNFIALQRAIDRRPNAKGVAVLNRIIREYIEAPDTRSKLERDFLALSRRAGLPEPRLNAIIAGLTVDVYWPQWRLVIELDGRGYHRSPRQFETDRLRDAKLQRLGIRVLRITRQRLDTEPAAILDDIRALASLA